MNKLRTSIYVARYKVDKKIKAKKIKVTSKLPTHLEATLKALTKINGHDLIEVLTLQRYNEIKIMKGWLKENEPTTRMKQTIHKCFRCKKKMRRRTIKYKFRRRTTEGKIKVRYYCEDCVEHIPDYTMEKLEFAGTL